MSTFHAVINRPISPPIKVKLYHKANWDSINSSISYQLVFLLDQICNLINFENPYPININNAVNISTSNSSSNKTEKLKRAFIKLGTLFLYLL